MVVDGVKSLLNETETGRGRGGMMVDVSVLIVAKACSIGSSRAIIPLELDPTICDEQKRDRKPRYSGFD